MTTFKNIESFNKYANKKIEIILNNIGKQVLEKLRENVSKSVYGWTPKRYKRTMQVLNSISMTKAMKYGNQHRVLIYFDVRKIQPIIRSGQWNAHMDMNGESVVKTITGENLIKWLEEGTEGSPYYNHKEGAFVKKTVEWIHGEFLNLLTSELNRIGIPYK